jgi:hypothetical protein
VKGADEVVSVVKGEGARQPALQKTRNSLGRKGGRARAERVLVAPQSGGRGAQGAKAKEEEEAEEEAEEAEGGFCVRDLAPDYARDAAVVEACRMGYLRAIDFGLDGDTASECLEGDEGLWGGDCSDTEELTCCHEEQDDKTTTDLDYPEGDEADL